MSESDLMMFLNECGGKMTTAKIVEHFHEDPEVQAKLEAMGRGGWIAGKNGVWRLLAEVRLVVMTGVGSYGDGTAIDTVVVHPDHPSRR